MQKERERNDDFGEEREIQQKLRQKRKGKKKWDEG